MRKNTIKHKMGIYQKYYSPKAMKKNWKVLGPFYAGFFGVGFLMWYNGWGIFNRDDDD